jgi:hypothetical protein
VSAPRSNFELCVLGDERDNKFRIIITRAFVVGYLDHLPSIPPFPLVR